MNKARMWTLGILSSLLAAADWFVVATPAGDGEDPKNQLSVGNAKVAALIQEVEKDGKKEKHLFLSVTGDGKGAIKVRLQETKINRMARMMPLPTTKWEKDIAIDTSKEKSIDLGVVPAEEKQTSATRRGSVKMEVFRWLEASNDGKAYIRLLSLGDKTVRGQDE